MMKTNRNHISLFGQNSANIIGNDIQGDIFYKITNNYYSNGSIWNKIQNFFKNNKHADIDVGSLNYLRKKLPLNENEEYVDREIELNFFDKNQNGLVTSCLGLPKMGKTTLIAQKCKNLDSNIYRYYWFDVPYTLIEQEEFNRIFFEVIANIFCKELNINVDLSNIEEFFNSIRLRSLSKKYLFVFDNYDNLPNEYQEKINNFIQIVKNHDFGKSLAFVFIINKNISNIMYKINNKFSYPQWRKDEIAQLLQRKKINYENTPDYLNFLLSLSGGHPLLAAIYAKQFPTCKEIINKKLIEQSITGEETELSNEIKSFLFNKIIDNDKERDVIIELSCLSYRFKTEIIDYACSLLNVNTKLFIEKYKNNILEGDDQIGFQIPKIYKDVASQYITKDEKLKFYRKAGKVFTQIHKDKVNDIDIIFCGIECLLLAQQYDLLFSSVIFLLYILSQSKVQLPIDYIERLNILTLIDSSSLKISNEKFYYVKLLIAIEYFKLNSFKKALKLLLGIPFDINLYNLGEKRNIFTNMLFGIIEITVLQIYIILEKYNDFFTYFSGVKYIQYLENQINNVDYYIFSFLKIIINLSDNIILPADKIKEFIKPIKNEKLEIYIDFFRNIGYKAYKLNKYDIIDKLKNTNVNEQIKKLWNYLCIISDIEYNFRNDKVDVSSLINSKLQYIQNSLYKETSLQAHLEVYNGDLNFNENKKTALSSYQKSLSHINKCSIYYKWVTYRLGLLTSGIQSINYYKDSLSSYNETPDYEYNTCDYLRLLGEISIYYYENKQYKRFLSMMHFFIDNYFNKNNIDFGSFVTIAGNFLWDIDKNILNDMNQELFFPKIEKGIFDKLRTEVKPKDEYTKLIAYIALTDFAYKNNCNKQAIIYGRNSLNIFEENYINGNLSLDTQSLIFIIIYIINKNVITEFTDQFLNIHHYFIYYSFQQNFNIIDSILNGVSNLLLEKIGTYSFLYYYKDYLLKHDELEQRNKMLEQVNNAFIYLDNIDLS